MRKGWEYKKLGDCFSYIKNGANIKQKKDADGFPITRIETLSGGVFNRDRMGYAGIHDLSKYANYVLESKDLLMSHINSKTYIGRTVEYKRNNEETIIHGMNLLRLKAIHELIDSTFFAYYTQSGDFKSKIARIRKDAVNQSSFAISDLKRFDIPLPPKSTQLAIVTELDKINELIRLKKEQLKDFDNLAQSLFYEMFGDPVENEKGWEVKKLGEICTDITDGDHMPPPKSEFGIPFITISDIDKDTRCLNFENTFYVPEDYYNNLKENRKPQKGDLLYTVTGTYGIPVIVKTNKKFCFQRHIALLRPNKEILSTIFLCYWVLSDGVKFMADKVATGIAQKTVGLNSIRKFSCILPPLPLQQLFAQRIEQIEREKSEVQKSIQDLETLLASRMQYWFE